MHPGTDLAHALSDRFLRYCTTFHGKRNRIESNRKEVGAMLRIGRNLMALFIVNLFTALCITMVNPLLPLFIQSLGASVFEISQVLFLGGLAAAALYIPSGLLSDRYGRKKIIALSSLMAGISAFLYTFATSWELAIPGAMMFAGSFAVFLPARMALIAESSRPKTRATVYGIMNIAWPIGGIIGPTLGGILADTYGWASLFYFVAITALLNLIPAFFLKETDKRNSKKSEKEPKGPLLSRKILFILLPFLVFHVVGNTGRGILGQIVPLYLTQEFQISKTQVGLFFSLGFGVATLIAQVPSGLLADKYGRKKVMAYCIFIIPLFPILWPWLNNYLLLMILYMLITGLWSATWPSSVAYLMDLTSESKRGITVSLRQTAVQLGFTVGPIIGGYLWEAYGPTTSFYASAIFFAASFLLVLFLKE